MEQSDDEQKDPYRKQQQHQNEGHNGDRASLTTGSQDDEDDWSRRVETDETMVNLEHHDDRMMMMESVVEEATINNNEHSNIHHRGPHSQRELTLKEKLVMREREQRIETERARLKRQFALSHAEESVESLVLLDHTESDHDDRNHLNAGLLQQQQQQLTEEVSRVDNDYDNNTLGEEESIVAHPDEETRDEAHLGFNMERFLRNSDTFDPQAKEVDDDIMKKSPDQGVLMERFLNEPVIPEISIAAINEQENRGLSSNANGTLHESVLWLPSDSALIPSMHEHVTASGIHSSSTLIEADRDDIIVSRRNPVDDHPSDVVSSDEPRVFRLTEADMEELAAIDEASIGNAPPSEREDTLSETGDLAGFVGLNAVPFTGNMSTDTPTTAQDDSVTTSLFSGVQVNNLISERDRHSDQHSVEGVGVSTVPPHLVLSPPVSSNDTIEAHPTSVSARDDDTVIAYQNEPSSAHYDDGLLAPNLNRSVLSNQSSKSLEGNEELAGTASSDQYRPDTRTASVAGPHEINVIHIAAPESPLPAYVDSTTGAWSPNGSMNVSPLQSRRHISDLDDPIPNYGALESGEMFSKIRLVHEVSDEQQSARREAEPLLSQIPPKIVMQGDISGHEASEVKINIKTVFAIGIIVGLAVGILIGEALIPLMTK